MKVELPKQRLARDFGRVSLDDIEFHDIAAAWRQATGKGTLWH
jgi:PHP family Zn ribbon phosphoesterase